MVYGVFKLAIAAFCMAKGDANPKVAPGAAYLKSGALVDAPGQDVGVKVRSRLVNTQE
jgi:hypothetical protein